MGQSSPNFGRMQRNLRSLNLFFDLSTARFNMKILALVVKNPQNRQFWGPRFREGFKSGPLPNTRGKVWLTRIRWTQCEHASNDHNCIKTHNKISAICGLKFTLWWANIAYPSQFSLFGCNLLRSEHIRTSMSS